MLTAALPSGEQYRFNLHEATWVDFEALDDDVAGQAQRYAFYAMLHVGVKDALRTAARELAAYVADVSEAVRAELGPKATETHVRQAIAVRDPYRQLQARIDELERAESRLGVVREALVHRRDMLRAAVMLRAPELGMRPAETPAPRYRLK